MTAAVKLCALSQAIHISAVLLYLSPSQLPWVSLNIIMDIHVSAFVKCVGFYIIQYYYRRTEELGDATISCDNTGTIKAAVHPVSLVLLVMM